MGLILNISGLSLNHFSIASKGVFTLSSFRKELVFDVNCKRLKNALNHLPCTYGISKDTVVAVLKKTLKVPPYFLTGEDSEKLKDLEVEIRFEGEMGEF